MLKLPKAFITEMTELWSSYDPPGDLEDFLASFQDEPSAGLVLNRLKVQTLSDLSCGDLPPVPWAWAGYFLPQGHKLSSSLAYRQGLFYLQDPSAMLPADLADAQPGEKVLDLCAAPGGKAFAVLGSLGDQGLLWANEINEKRARALSRNVELAGSALCLISCRDALGFAQQLSGALPVFDLVLADVPCTGSAMFRKDPRALRSWSRYRGQVILDLQAAILEEAAANLRPGGRLVYSTCSYSWAENEGQLIRFLDRHPDFSLLPACRPEVSPGLADPDGRYPTTYSLRIWPHLARGEGQFAALLVKAEDPAEPMPEPSLPLKQKNLRPDRQVQTSWEAFRQDNLSGQGRLAAALASQDFNLRTQEDKLHLVPAQAPLARQSYYMKTGLYLGQSKGEGEALSFQPSQALVQFLSLEDLSWALDLADGPLLRASLRGETLLRDQVLAACSRQEAHLYHEGACLSEDAFSKIKAGAYLALTQQGRPLMWLKQQDHFFKNAYPRSWI